MAAHNDLGKRGEKIAVNYLLANGYSVLEQNYRFSRAEIDIIAKKDNILVFIEVKTRSNVKWGYPEVFVNKRKVDLFMDTAYHYMEKIGHEREIRFDIISIVLSKNSPMDFRHFQDAFVP